MTSETASSPASTRSPARSPLDARQAAIVLICIALPMLAAVLAFEEVPRITGHLPVSGGYALGAIAFVIAVTAIAMGVAIRRLRQALAPLADLADAASRLATRPDRSDPLPLTGDDDARRIAAAFNTLLSAIKAHDAEIKNLRRQMEQEMEQRTRQLAREQARFEGIFESAPVGFSWMIRDRADTRIVNPANVRITGVPLESSRDVTRYRQATHPEDRARQDELHARLVAGEIDHYEIDKRYVHADGRERWVTLSVRTRRDAETGEWQEIKTVVDITDRRQAERELAQAGRLLDVLLENVADFIYFKDLESRFVRYSRAFVNRFGLTDPKDLFGKRDFDLFTTEHAKAAFDDEQEIIRTGNPVVGKLERETYSDGRVTWALTTKLPWRDEKGKIVGTFGISKDITVVKEAEAKLADTHRQLLDLSRQAGMAEVATGVLHNVGNVLNSINVSATLISEHVRHSKAGNIAKLAALFAQHKADLADFLTKDPRGQMVPTYLETLGESLAQEQTSAMAEIDNLRRNVDHIKDIVAMQQAYARTSGVVETVSVPDLIEDALRINSGSLARHDVGAVREYNARGVITTDKHKVIQILINLVRNAKYACDESGRTDKKIVVRTTSDPNAVQIAVIDNGVGILAENLTRIFSHGFTTRKEGHGFGLHSAALAAKELGGKLTVHSDGPGKGATFILELPHSTEKSGHEPAR